MRNIYKYIFCASLCTDQVKPIYSMQDMIELQRIAVVGLTGISVTLGWLSYVLYQEFLKSKKIADGYYELLQKRKKISERDSSNEEELKSDLE